MNSVTLYRQDETQWAFQKGDQEIRLITPGFRNRAEDYLLADRLKSFLASQPTISSWLAWEYPSNPQEAVSSDILGRWQIKDVTKEESTKLQDGSIIYRRTFSNLNVRVLRIVPTSALQTMSLALKKWIPWLQTPPPFTKKMGLPYEPDSQTVFFENGLYQDPFTRLSESALQKFETPFISEAAHQGSFHFTLEDGILLLRHNSRLALSTGTTDAIIAYRDYLRKVFEWRTLRTSQAGLEADLKTYPDTFDSTSPQTREQQFLGYLKESCGIDFDAMIKEKKPLLPDHIYKCNIAANQIEMAYVESFHLRFDRYLKTKLLQLSPAEETKSFETVSQFYDFLKEKELDGMFSLREVEGIYKSFVKEATNKSFSELQKYLSSFSYIAPVPKTKVGESVRFLHPQAFHRIMDILYSGFESLSPPATKSPEHFFAGRKILHLAICGYKTMGDKSTQDQTRNVAELLHVFPLLKKSNTIGYTELLAHVVSKKALHQRYPTHTSSDKIEWRAGRLIPFTDDTGISRWYYVDGYFNDGKGDVNYVLIPVCKGYLETGCADVVTKTSQEKRSPLIKLYRSTASSAEAESSTDSILADLNPTQVGSLDFDRGDEYERPYFYKCTMPVWVGYLTIGDVDRAAQSFLEAISTKNRLKYHANGKEENLLRFLEWQRKDKSKTTTQIYQEFKKRVGVETLRTFFEKSALGSEWATENKIPQDIYFVGHSLGAALSQNSVYHFGPREGRIPLSGCNFKCFAFDPPGGVTKQENEAFLNFGRKHKELLKSLKQKWEILYQLEYQDFVPQGGTELLGITKENQGDDEWLNITAMVCRPLETAQSLEITTMPTHGRRFRHLSNEEAKKEHQELPLSTQELYTFKHSVWLPLELRLKFGFFISTPHLTEKLRRAVGGTVLFSAVWFKKKWEDLRNQKATPDKDAAGVTFYSVKHPDHAAEESSV